MTGGEFGNGLRDVLLPNRTDEEIKLQLVRIENTICERRGSKLQELQKLENKQFAVEEKARAIVMEEDYKRRRSGMDDILGLAERKEDSTVTEEGEIDKRVPSRSEGEYVKATLDHVLGLVEESEEQRRKRELDEALGL